MHRRLWPCETALLFAVLLLTGCDSRRAPIVLVAGPVPGRGPDLRVAKLALGEQLRWRTVDGQSGAGALLAVEADSLVLVERRACTYSGRPTGTAGDNRRQLRRIALVDLVELTRRDRQAEPYLSTLIGVPILAVTLLLLLFALDPPVWPTN
jgi:hypothetical protein